MNRSLFYGPRTSRKKKQQLVACFYLCLVLYYNHQKKINTFRNSNTGNKCKKGAPRISAGGTFYFHPCFFVMPA